MSSTLIELGCRGAESGSQRSAGSRSSAAEIGIPSRSSRSMMSPGVNGGFLHAAAASATAWRTRDPATAITSWRNASGCLASMPYLVQFARREVLEVDRDDHLRLAGDGGSEDMAVVRVRQVQPVDERFETFN